LRRGWITTDRGWRRFRFPVRAGARRLKWGARQLNRWNLPARRRPDFLKGGFMVPILDLWMPIVVSAVAVFLLSSIIHMALRYHSNDYSTLAQEDAVMAALRPFKIPPGEYAVPAAGTMAAMKTPEFQAKQKEGPVLFMTVCPNGPYQMGTNLALWFVYSLVVGAFAALIAGGALPAGAHRHAIVHFTGLVAFAGYSLALLQGSIWWRRRWSTTLKSMFDGLLYAAATAAIFVWLWPR
jgi:hypothetical protein